MAFTIENGVLVKCILKDEEEEVVIPEGVTSIGDSAFELCEYLFDVTIPEGVTSIGEKAFFMCFSLTSVTIPESVTKIGGCAFEDCKSLTSVTIPEGVRRIGYFAFYECKRLTSVTISETVTSIENYAFYETPWLKYYPDDLVIVNGILLAYKGKGAHVTIPESVTSIGDHAFDECEGLTSVTMYGITFAPKKLKGGDFHDAMEMLQNKDFSMKLNHDVKYAVIIGFYLKTADADAEAYVKKNFPKMFRFLIENNSVEAIQKLLDSGKFITKKNIDKFIASAIEHTQNGGSPEIQTMLMHHKAEVLGYSDPNAQFRL